MSLDKSITQETSFSQYQFFSLGIVANNKELDSNVINVVPYEATPFLDGEIASIPFSTEVQGQDAAGGHYTVKVSVDQALPAMWLPFGTSNRATPPDVRRGERVMIWRYADTDQYFWTDMNLDLKYRKLETVRFTYSATTDEEADPRLPGNCYFIEISTHKQTITLQTSQVNGEFCIYSAQFNLKDGRFIVTDDLGNEVSIDSAATQIYLRNADDSYIDMTNKKIRISALDRIEVEATNTIWMKTKDFSIECDTYQLDASSSVKINTQDYKLDTSQYTMNCSQGTISGQIRFTDQCSFDAQIQAKGMRSSLPIIGPSDTI